MTARDEIGRLLKESEENLTKTNDDFIDSIKGDLQKFKAKALDQILKS